MKQHGFTLTELIMVIVLVSIIATFAATRFDSSDFDNQATAIELIEAIRYAQAQAMAHSGADSDGDGNYDRYRINLNDGTDSYSIVIDDIDSPNLGNVASLTDGTANYSQSWTTGVDITPSVASISFNSRGEPVGGGATIGINGVIIITVEPITGYVYQ